MAAISQEQINVDLFDEVNRLKELLKNIENEWRNGTDSGLDAILESTFNS